MRNHAAAAELRAGTVLEQAYKLTRLVSEGSMGTVYEGVQLRLEKRVAVKLMQAELARNTEALARFRREVKVMAQLTHPHIVQLLDFGMTAAGQPYLVTEYLEGEDLERRLLRVEKLALPDTFHIVRQVASALASIHAKGIVHRDLKPANVFLLSMDGGYDFAKLVDFGIAKLRTSDSRLTKAFLVVGTPEYMSPEQASGRVDDVDHRSDQWALACTAWRMLTGKAPFGGGGVNEILQNILRAELPPLDALAPHLPVGLERVLRRALAKRQSARFPTIMAFSRAFQTAAEVNAH
jgi:eukaryotic-like serine/threonine-protein kinase